MSRIAFLIALVVPSTVLAQGGLKGLNATLDESRVADKIASGTKALYALRKEKAAGEALLKRFESAEFNTKKRGTLIPTDERLPVIFRTKRDQAAAIAELQKKLADIEAVIAEKEADPYELLRYPPRTDDFGNLIGATVKVQSVIDTHTILVRVENMAPTTKRLGGRLVDVPQAEPILLLVKERSTEGVAEGAAIELTEAFVVKRSEQATLPDGTKESVLVLEPLDTAVIERMVAERRKLD